MDFLPPFSHPCTHRMPPSRAAPAQYMRTLRQEAFASRQPHRPPISTYTCAAGSGGKRGLSLGEGSPTFMLKVKSSVSLAFPLSKCHFDAFPARGKLPMKSVFHSKMYSLLYVEVIGIT